MAMNERMKKGAEVAFRVLHTADWHLGKTLCERSRDEEHGRFLDWLLDLVRSAEADAVVLAGDVFDTANPPQSALSRYYDFVARLRDAGSCRLVVVGGNHDSPALLNAPGPVLTALNTTVAGKLASASAERVLLLPDAESPRLAVGLVPFMRERELRTGEAGETFTAIEERLREGITTRYRETAAAVAELRLACPALVTGHLTVVGAAASDSERDIHVGGLGAVDSGVFPAEFSYVALGHLHRPQQPGNDERVRYSGSPIPLSFSEATDRKEVRLVDFRTDGTVRHEGVEIPRFRSLEQLRCTLDEVDGRLRSHEPPTSELRAWVEVQVTDASVAGDLNERVRLAAEGRPFEVLKVMREGGAAAPGGAAADPGFDETADGLLDRPDDVFARLLEQRPDVVPERRERLTEAFSKLRELHAEGAADEVGAEAGGEEQEVKA